MVRRQDADSPRLGTRVLRSGSGAAAGLAGHEDDLAMPGPSLEKELAQPLQLGFASKEPAALAWPVRVRSRTGGFPLLGRRHVRNEADAAAVDRLDEEGMAGIVAERPAQLGDHLRHGSGPDFHVRPDGVEQLRGGREPTRVLDEISQDMEGLGSQIDRRVCPPQPLILEIEPERRKLKHLGPQQTAASEESRTISGFPHVSGPLEGHDARVASSRPSVRTFVVQCNGDADLGRGRLSGRVEHVASGQRQRFDSVQEMLQFVARAVGEEDETTEQMEER